MYVQVEFLQKSVEVYLEQVVIQLHEAAKLRRAAGRFARPAASRYYIYVHVYVCVCVCVYVCMYIRMYVCMYVCMYVFMYVCMYVCMYIYVYICRQAEALYKPCRVSVLHTHTHTHTRTHTHTHTHTHTGRRHQ